MDVDGGLEGGVGASVGDPVVDKDHRIRWLEPTQHDVRLGLPFAHDVDGDVGRAMGGEEGGDLGAVAIARHDLARSKQGCGSHLN